MLKRSVDVVLAGLLLAVSLPLIALAIVVIKLDSKGPALFRQTRMGRGFRGFQLLKLRTMQDSVTGPVYTLGEDPRITSAGQWLRWFKLDELPQLWNVLLGDMSLVGPRPVIPALAVEFKCAYERLLRVRPGLTDPATLKYFRETEILAQASEPFRYFKTVVTPDKLRISQAYLLRANLGRDLAVMARTALALLTIRKARVGQPGMVPPRKTPRMHSAPLFVPGKTVLPVLHPATQLTPVELLPALGGSEARLTAERSNQSMERVTRSESMFRRWDEQRFLL